MPLFSTVAIGCVSLMTVFALVWLVQLRTRNAGLACAGATGRDRSAA